MMQTETQSMTWRTTASNGHFIHQGLFWSPSIIDDWHGIEYTPFVTPCKVSQPITDPLEDLLRKSLEYERLKNSLQDSILEAAKRLPNDQLETLIYRLDILLGSRK